MTEQLVDVGVQTFKEYVVKLLVTYLHQHINDKLLSGMRSSGPAPVASIVFAMLAMPGPTTTWELRSTGAIARDKLRPPPLLALTLVLFGALWEITKKLAIEHKAILANLGDPFNFP